MAIKSHFKKVTNHLKFVFGAEISELSRVSRFLVHKAKVFYFACWKFSKDFCGQRASALAYKTLIALVPISAILFVVLEQFRLVSGKDLLARLEEFILKGMKEAPAQKAIEKVSFISKELARGKAAIGVIGTVFLIITAVWLLSTIEAVFNEIWKVKKQRKFLIRFNIYWSVLTLGGVLCGCVIYFLSVFAHSEVYKNIENIRVLGSTIRVCTPYLSAWLLFYLLYQFVPYTKVRPKAAFWGGVSGGTFWLWSMMIFDWHLRQNISYKKIYGALAIIPIFLILLYLTWVFVLLGAEFSYAIQNYGELDEAHRRISKNKTSREYLAIKVMHKIAEDFTKGRLPPTLINLSQELSIPLTQIDQILENLKRSDVIVELEARGYQPKRAISKIKICDILGSYEVKSWQLPEAKKDESKLDAYLRDKFLKVNTSTQDIIGNLSFQELIDRTL